MASAGSEPTGPTGPTVSNTGSTDPNGATGAAPPPPPPPPPVPPGAVPGPTSSAPPPGCAFTDCVLIPNAAAPIRIDLIPNRVGPGPTDDMLSLWSDIRAVQRVVNTIFDAYPDYRKNFLTQLWFATRVGLVCDRSNIKSGRANLDEVKDNIADAFPLVRNALWWSYAKVLMQISVVLGLGGLGLFNYLCVGTVFRQHNQELLTQIPAFPQICLAAVWIPVGVSFGLFLEFIFRVGDNLTYDALLTINPGRWRPWPRTLSTLLTAYVFAFFLAINVFTIGIGSVVLNEFIKPEHIYYALAIGFITGFSFPYVRDLLTNVRPEQISSSQKSPNPPKSGGASNG